MRARELEVLAQKISQMLARLHVALDRLAVDGGLDGDVLKTDEIGRSANVKHLANIAPSGVLAQGVGTDLAFQDDKAFVGNYDGFSIIDIRNPKKPKTIVQVSCPGSQNDISVSGDLLYLSTDSSRCSGTRGCSGPPSASVQGPRRVSTVRTSGDFAAGLP